MPMNDEEYFGIEADGTSSKTYCAFCYQDGVFTKPDISMSQMIELSVQNMTEDLQIPEDRATALANEVIPTLSRWQPAAQT